MCDIVNTVCAVLLIARVLIRIHALGAPPNAVTAAPVARRAAKLSDLSRVCLTSGRSDSSWGLHDSTLTSESSTTLRIAVPVLDPSRARSLPLPSDSEERLDSPRSRPFQSYPDAARGAGVVSASAFDGSLMRSLKRALPLALGPHLPLSCPTAGLAPRRSPAWCRKCLQAWRCPGGHAGRTPRQNFASGRHLRWPPAEHRFVARNGLRYDSEVGCPGQADCGADYAATNVPPYRRPRRIKWRCCRRLGWRLASRLPRRLPRFHRGATRRHHQAPSWLPSKSSSACAMPHRPSCVQATFEAFWPGVLKCAYALLFCDCSVAGKGRAGLPRCDLGGSICGSSEGVRTYSLRVDAQ